ncbi:peptidase [Brevundimonas staleyi]|uniref:Peptidase n=1 Tax=Brevundimonas staleyi TaxID=74326 RepID=A0ABW0FXG8_9CAUL
MKIGFGLAVVACGVLALTTGAAAQDKGQKNQTLTVDVTLPATFGSTRLSSGFTPDPYRVDIYSGGTIDATTVANGCVGMVARAPDFELTYSAGSLPLIFGVTSDADTTLVINGPNGRWYCDDDSGDGTNPLMRIPNPPSGVYDVYVGAYGGNSGSSQLYITELESNLLGRSGSSSNNNTSSSGVLDPFAAANYGRVELRAGFTPDPYQVNMRAGGSTDAQNVSSNCRGFVSRAPDVELSYTAGSLPLVLSVDSASDTTLVVNGPDGRWYCDDDGGNGSLNPALRFNNPQTGTYDIWVGTYSSGASQPARLDISELYSN